jgi:Ca2+-binding EF-hand superfamily protein
MKRTSAFWLAATLLLGATGASALAPWDARPQVRYTFRGLDLDADGSLTKAETRFAQDLRRGFAVADSDGNGVLARAEYDEAMALQAELYGDGAHSTRKRELFASLDGDADGALSREEAQRHAGIARGFRYADTDGDGRVDAAEFGEISLETLAK